MPRTSSDDRLSRIHRTERLLDMSGTRGFAVRDRGGGRGRGCSGPIQFGPGAPRMPFDLVMFQSSFPTAESSPDEATLIKRNTDLTPTIPEQTALLKLVNILQRVLNSLMISQSGKVDACQMGDVRHVGSFKKGTMMMGHNVADIVVVLKTLPTPATIQVFGKQVQDQLRTLKQGEALNVACTINEQGLVASTPDATVQVLITTYFYNMCKLVPGMHLDKRILHRHLAAIRHSVWFDSNVHLFSIKALIRLLRDLTNRFEGLNPLSTWMLDLLSHYAVTNTPDNQALPLTQAYRRALQLLAGGLFLPGSAGICNCSLPADTR